MFLALSLRLRGGTVGVIPSASPSHTVYHLESAPVWWNRQKEPVNLSQLLSLSTNSLHHRVVSENKNQVGSCMQPTLWLCSVSVDSLCIVLFNYYFGERPFINTLKAIHKYFKSINQSINFFEGIMQWKCNNLIIHYLEFQTCQSPHFTYTWISVGLLLSRLKLFIDYYACFNCIVYCFIDALLWKQFGDQFVKKQYIKASNKLNKWSGNT